MARELRFRPPSFAWSSDVRWALDRAFSDRPVPHEGLETPVETARSLWLTERIAARIPESQLRQEVGDEDMAQLQRARREAIAGGILLDSTLREVARLAAARELPLILLKFAALSTLDPSLIARRTASDVDVLVTKARARELFDLLCANGFNEGTDKAYEHHLPALSVRGGLLEIHIAVPGVRLVPGRSATFEDLVAAGETRSTAGFPGRVLVPSHQVLLAHALAHGIAQHGAAPRAYPQTRMFADLADLGFAAPDSTGPPSQWLATTVSAAETEACRDLVAALCAGRAEALDPASSAAVLLRHVLAGVFDERYARSLRLSALGPGAGDARGARRALAELGAALWPTAGQLEALYGRPEGIFGRLRQRLWRPLDLAARVVGHLRAWLSLRR